MKKLLSLILLLTLSISVSARPQERAVVIDTVCNAPLQALLRSTNLFCRQFQTYSDSLYKWAYVGLEETKESKTAEVTKESRNAIILDYKERVYDPKKRVGDLTVDIYVLGVRWWKDQHLGTRTVVRRPASSPYPLTVHMTATYSGSILEGGDFIMQMEPISENQTRVHYEFRLAFGKVLAAFISDKTWRSAIEWRFSTILENIIEYTETGSVKPKKRGPQK